MQSRVRGMLDMLPDSMSRAMCAAFVRDQLARVLAFNSYDRRPDKNPITAVWVGDKLHVQVPTRLHYAEHIIYIKEAIGEALSRVNFTDVSKFTTEEFANVMRNLRGN